MRKPGEFVKVVDPRDPSSHLVLHESDFRPGVDVRWEDAPAAGGSAGGSSAGVAVSAPSPAASAPVGAEGDEGGNDIAAYDPGTPPKKKRGGKKKATAE